MSGFKPGGLTWVVDLPDPRDYTPDHEAVARLLLDLKPRRRYPTSVDWREYCGPVEDQADLGTGAVHACLGLLAYCLRRAAGQTLDPSWWFLYQVAQRVAPQGACRLRTVCKAIVRFGVPAERYWRYDPAGADQQPDAFVYAAAKRFCTARYVRLDARGEPPEARLARIKAFLAAGFACTLGFSVFTSISIDPEIPFPTIFDAVRGGQAVLAVGYDDNRRIRSDRGALLVRSSWGPAWGEGGYGWLPYAYVREQLARDFWTLLEPHWLASGEFQRPVWPS